MATNRVVSGATLTYTPSGASLASGQAFLLGALVAVAITDIADGETGAVAVAGAYRLPSATGASTGWPQGAALFWDNTAKVVTSVAAGNTLAGFAASAKADGDSEAVVILNGMTD